MKLFALFEARKDETDTREGTYQKWEGLMDANIEPFNVTVTYEVTTHADEYHPYGGGGRAREAGVQSVEVIDAVADQEVKMTDEDEKVIETFPKGTKVYRLPGWNKSMWKDFEKFAEHEL